MNTDKVLESKDLQTESVVPHLGENIFYGVSIQHRPSGQVIALGANKPMIIPRVGESLQVQGIPAQFAGFVTSIHHTYGISNAAAPSMQCHVWIVVG